MAAFRSKRQIVEFLIHCPSISARRQARHTTERVREMLLVRKPALPRNFRKANIWIRQEQFRMMNSHPHNVAVRRHAQRRLEQAYEILGAYAADRSQIVQLDAIRDISFDKITNRADAACTQLAFHSTRRFPLPCTEHDKAIGYCMRN